MIKSYLNTAIGVIGGAITSIYGGWTAGMTTLLIFMIIDFITGYIVAIVFKNSTKTESGGVNSSIGWQGLAKKCMVLLFLLIGQRLDMTLGTSYIRDTICIGFIANEIISITENATLMGFPVPAVVTNALDILSSKKEQ